MNYMNNWDKFFKEKVEKILREKEKIIDIGGGLRVVKEKNNRYDKTREWIRPLLNKVDYKVFDPVPDYNPDIIGDIQNLPFLDNSQDAIICIAVLEHVPNPIKACQELHRVLKKGGYCFVYVPFLYYYHAERGYYKDYWRFSKDCVDFLFNDFSCIEKMPVRGAIETWIKISPMGRYKIILDWANKMDKIFNKLKTSQVSGYYVFLEK